MIDLKAELNKNPFVLAPMAGITDNSFRTFMREMGCGPVITELVSAYGIEYKSHRTIDLMSFSEKQRPIGVQLFGEEGEVLARAAQFVEEQRADFVDINLGCPVPKVVKKGAGAALLREPLVLFKILVQIKSAIKIPLTIKIRTGWDDKTINAHDIVKAAADAGVSWVAIHGRTRAQGYSGLADWDLIGEVKAKASIPIIGNGDINSAATAVRRLRESGCDGVMIGRGCLKNPWIFKQAQELIHNDYPQSTDKDFCKSLGRLKELVDERNDVRYSMLQMKKFAAWFSAGYPGSQNFRKSLFQAPTADEILHIAGNYFSQFDLSAQSDTSHESFLMGGHG
ncbi:MAG: tRNA dihydrouridine synthase DusB [Oligoflexia bacterium]|nr:tRNA dihydrouridine synthase DusB [Oligoflexia bacterium]